MERGIAAPGKGHRSLTCGLLSEDVLTDGACAQEIRSGTAAATCDATRSCVGATALRRACHAEQVRFHPYTLEVGMRAGVVVAAHPGVEDLAVQAEELGLHSSWGGSCRTGLGAHPDHATARRGHDRSAGCSSRGEPAACPCSKTSPRWRSACLSREGKTRRRSGWQLSLQRVRVACGRSATLASGNRLCLGRLHPLGPICRLGQVRI